MWVAEKLTADPHVVPFDDIVGPEGPVRKWLRSTSETLPLFVQKSSNSVHRSFGLISRGITPALERLQPEVVHLHWMGSGTMSLREIGEIARPVVWTLHDSWPFCGAEHHPESPVDVRFRESYSRASRSPGNSRADVDAWTFRRKKRLFGNPRWLVGPSTWMVDQAATAALTHGWPATVIPNPIDTDVFAPVDQQEARRRLGIDPDAQLVLFGGMAAAQVHGKGWDLLEQALQSLAPNGQQWEVRIFGADAPVAEVAGVPITSIGVVDDPRTLATWYSAADVHVVPSRMESFSQTAAEAIACGTPVVAFKVGGLTDVVADADLGILVEPFDVGAFGAAMQAAPALKVRTRQAGPRHAHATWRTEVVANEYLAVYRAARETWAAFPAPPV